ncbi:AMP-binding enzyme domain-containing protein [Phthorimaea operculella]|nr:AMP-binding enzyme domain-containing protein [Phthorimaea operculella]
MHRHKRENDACRWYIEELSSRVVAESGRACDRFHLGKLILRGLKDAPDHILQIDAETGESETSGSVLERSVRCAIAMKKSGIQKGDVIVLLAPNHLDVTVVYYAALYIGATFSSFDRNMRDDELAKILNCDQPKFIFCHASKLADIEDALSKINLKTNIVTFEGNANGYCTFAEFMKRSGDDIVVDEFKAADFDPETTIAALIASSGTTGVPKKAVITHKNFIVSGHQPW